MGWFDKLFKKEIKRGVSYQVFNGKFISPSDNKSNYITEGYALNDLIYSIVNLIADKVRVPTWGLYKVVDESSLKKANALLSRKNISGEDFKQALFYKTKALKEANDMKLDALLDTPDGYCTFQDLVANSSIFKLLTGDRMIWAELLNGGANGGKPQSLHILPSDLLTMTVTNSFPFNVVSYQITDWGLIEGRSIPKEAVLHDKYFNPIYSSAGDHLWGLSPLKAAAYLSTKSNEALKTEAAQFLNQGPRKVMFIDEPKKEIDPAIAGTQIQQIKLMLQGKEYGGSDNQGKIPSSGYKIGVVDVGLSPVELGIIESEKWSLRRFCNVYGVPSQLLNDPNNKTFNNQKEGEVALTTRCAIPQLNSFKEHFNRKLRTDWGYKDSKLVIDYDVSCYSELQEDQKEKWEWVKELPVSWRYKLDLMGMDYEDNQPGLDEVMIPSGFTPIDDFIVDENSSLDGSDSGSGTD